MKAELNPVHWLDDLEGTLLRFIDPSTLIGALIYLVLFLLLGWAVSTVTRRSLQAAILNDKRHHIDPMAIGFLQDLAGVVIWVVMLVLYAHLIPGLRALGTALLAGASVVSVVVGLAAQSTLGNFVAGISLLLYRPFRVGDRLQVTAPTGVETGTVESLSLGYTILRCDRNRRVVLPNSGIANSVTINLTKMDQRLTLKMPVTIAPNADAEKARETLLKIASENRDAIEPFSCLVTELSPSGLTLTLQVQCADDGQAAGVRSDLFEQAAVRLPAIGVPLSMPTSQVILREAPLLAPPTQTAVTIQPSSGSRVDGKP